METPKTIETAKRKISFDAGFDFVENNVASAYYYNPSFRWNYRNKEIRISPFFTHYEMSDIVKDTGIATESVYGAEIGLKIPIFEKYLSGLCGGGFGFSNYGNFISGDVGVSLGFENKYLVPFVNNYVYLSIPYNTRTIINSDSLSLEPSVPPTTTEGWMVSGGLKLKIGEVAELKAALNYGAIQSQSSDVTLFGISSGLGVSF